MYRVTKADTNETLLKTTDLNEAKRVARKQGHMNILMANEQYPPIAYVQKLDGNVWRWCYAPTFKVMPTFGRNPLLNETTIKWKC